MDLDLVVVTHQSEAALPACLDALGPLADRVIAVDNASRDATRRLLARRAVRTLPLAVNAGFAAAANLGARSTRSRFLCFLNPDCVVGPEVFSAALAAMHGRDEVCAVPRLLEGHRVVDGRQPGYSTRKLLCDTLHSNYGDNPVCRWLRRDPRFHDRTWWWPHGACLFLPRSLFEVLGGFDDRFFLYMEDVDLGRRLAARGGRIVQLDGEVRHGGSAGSAIGRRRRLALLNRSRVRYAELYHGRWLARLLARLVLPSRALRAARGSRA